jgi:hypothetical protein
MGQGFLQRAAFPLQFEFLFDFPGPLAEDVNEPPSVVEKLLMAAELSVSDHGSHSAFLPRCFQCPLPTDRVASCDLQVSEGPLKALSRVAQFPEGGSGPRASV